MALCTAIYGSRIEADEYFLTKLHEVFWSEATVEEQDESLLVARRSIDTLSYKGCKATVFALLQADPCATDEEIREAEAAQALEFPRGEDTIIPEDIRIAEYEEAYARLGGTDPELEYEALSVTQQQIELVRTSFERSNVPSEHLVNGIGSLVAWRRLRPYLRDGRSLRLLRV